MATGFRRLLPLLAMVAVFAAPVLAAWFFYLNPEYLPAARSNRGELLEPVVPLEASLGLERAGGGAFDLSGLAGRWTLVTVSVGPCLEDCRRRLSDQGQVWSALGESRLSVERLLVVTTPPSGPAASAERLAADLRGVHVAVAGAVASTALAGVLGSDGLDRHYILDPLGRLMMRYAQNAPPEDLLKDMERLLKASKNWIKGAQYGHQ
jgi:cytochrome oxidase Cu insertion factor (SCO1/SenC/PrrC family)